MGYVGQSIKRVEDPRFIQGKGSYVANLQIPGMVYLAIKRSPYGHAKIKKIDTKKAAALPGVVGVFTGKDLLDGGCGALPCGWNVPDLKTPKRYALTVDKARHVGDAVAVVAAESPYIAADAVELIEVDYEPLKATIDARGSTEKGAPLVHDEIPGNVSYFWALGDKAGCETAFASAHKVVELELVNQRLIANAMEPRACVAHWNAPMEEMTVWTTSQNPQPIRLLLSAFTLGIPENRLRVISPDVGGGFGSKIFHYPEEIITPWVARALNRPAKWVATRSESSITDSQGRDHVTVAKLALDKNGIFTGLHVQTWANMGAYLSTFAPLIPTALYVTLFAGLYEMKGVWGEVWGTLTNTVPVDAYRGAGRPEASYMLERLVDLAARELAMDPVELRRKNFIRKNEFPYQTPVALLYDSGNYDGLFDKVTSLADYDKMRKDQEKARKDGKLVGIGVAGCIEASGPAPSAVAGSLGSAVGLWESGVLRVHPTGKVTALTGSHAHGQGHETTFAQVVADELGIDMKDVEVVHGDTGRVPFGMGTYGSRSAAVGGSALVRSAAESAGEAHEDRRASARGRRSGHRLRPGQGKGLREGVAGQRRRVRRAGVRRLHRPQPSRGNGAGPRGVRLVRPGELHVPQQRAHRPGRDRSRRPARSQLQRYIAVDDVGKVINPMIVEGQIIGGIVQGVGQALWEQGVYDESGQLLTGSMMEYTMPRAESFPKFEIGRIETPSPHNPLGVKGAGEMGTIAANGHRGERGHGRARAPAASGTWRCR